MYAKTNDILQFVYNSPRDMNSRETKYSFVLCPDDIEDYRVDVSIEIRQEHSATITVIDRAFHRFNVVLPIDTNHREIVVLSPYLNFKYKNRPFSELFEYKAEDFNDDEIPF